MSEIDMVTVGLGNFVKGIIENELPNTKTSWADYGRFDKICDLTDTLNLGCITVKFNTCLVDGEETDFVIAVTTRYFD